MREETKKEFVKKALIKGYALAVKHFKGEGNGDEGPDFAAAYEEGMKERSIQKTYIAIIIFSGIASLGIVGLSVFVSNWIMYSISFLTVICLLIIGLNWKSNYYFLASKINPKYILARLVRDNRTVAEEYKNGVYKKIYFKGNSEPYIPDKRTIVLKGRIPEYTFIEGHAGSLDYTDVEQNVDLGEGSVVVGSLVNAQHLDQMIAIEREHAEAKKDVEIVKKITSNLRLYILIGIGVSIVAAFLALTMYNEWRVLFPEGVGGCKGLKCLVDAATNAAKP